MKYLEHLNSNYINKTINLIPLSIYLFEKVNQSTVNSPLNYIPCWFLSNGTFIYVEKIR